MYNPRLLGSNSEYQIVTVTSGEAIAKNDFVTLKTDGQAEATDAGELIYGIALQAATAAAQSIKVVRAMVGMRVLMDCDQVGTTITSAHVGARVDMIGATGAQLVDSSSVAQTGTADAGQLLIKEVSPSGYGFDGDASIVICELSEVQ